MKAAREESNLLKAEADRVQEWVIFLSHLLVCHSAPRAVALLQGTLQCIYYMESEARAMWQAQQYMSEAYLRRLLDSAGDPRTDVDVTLDLQAAERAAAHQRISYSRHGVRSRQVRARAWRL